MISYTLLLSLLAIAYLSKNNSLVFAVVFLLLLKCVRAQPFMDLIQTKGVSWGITVLTLAVLVPLANEESVGKNLALVTKSYVSILAVVVGIMVSYVGGRGVQAMVQEPTLTWGLTVGTVIGVAFVGGVPVGPLIAAGIVALVSEIVNSYS